MFFDVGFTGFSVRYRCLRGATDSLALAVCYLLLVELLAEEEEDVVDLAEVMDGAWNLGTTSAGSKTSDPFEDEGREVVVHAAGTLSVEDPLCVELLSEEGPSHPSTQGCTVFSLQEPHVVHISQVQGILWEMPLQPLTEVIYTHSPSMMVEPVKRGRKGHKGCCWYLETVYLWSGLRVYSIY